MSGYVSPTKTRAQVEVVANPEYQSPGASRTIAAVTVVASGSGLTSQLIDESLTIATVTVVAKVNYYVYAGYPGNSAIWLARPQSTDFVVYESEKEGPIGAARSLLETDGWIYQAWKLGEAMIYYGQNSIMSGKYFFDVAPGIQRTTIHSVGILGKNAVCVDDIHQPRIHFFINKNLEFNILTEKGREAIDFSNHFASLAAKAVLSYDKRYDAVRIADGTYGFTFSVKEKALGWGPVNITGCGLDGNTFYVVSPAAISTPPLSCKSDILDFQSRDEKTIYELDFGTDVAQDLYAAIDYRWNKKESFNSTPWTKTDRFGRAFFLCTGIEFQIKWKMNSYGYMRLDHLPVRIKLATEYKEREQPTETVE